MDAKLSETASFAAWVRESFDTVWTVPVPVIEGQNDHETECVFGLGGTIVAAIRPIGPDGGDSVQLQRFDTVEEAQQCVSQLVAGVVQIIDMAQAVADGRTPFAGHVQVHRDGTYDHGTYDTEEEARAAGWEPDPLESLLALLADSEAGLKDNAQTVGYEV